MEKINRFRRPGVPGAQGCSQELEQETEPQQGEAIQNLGEMSSREKDQQTHIPEASPAGPGPARKEAGVARTPRPREGREILQEINPGLIPRLVPWQDTAVT